ncbi:hypothetical protein L6164_010523 [Bauhinia variegata]|uniref:Uncharacterized protein n=1 Tax=Bauhinia variegata TaxID=167791 RepID=A0ACB9PMI4_BAUVA|nr:hypothetical protein L6164_010523 [Bauhinia variegata]
MSMASSFKAWFFLVALALTFLLLLSGPAHCKDDEKDSVLKGINSYRQTLNLPVLNKVEKASCLADEIAEDLEDVPCENVNQYAPGAAGGNLRLPNFQKHVDKCDIDVNTTTDGAVLPVCVAKLVPTVVLSNYTHSDRYARYLNNTMYTGIGLGSEDDWMVIVLTSNTTAGSFSAPANAAPTCLHPHAWMELCYLLAFTALVLIMT